MLKHRLLTLLSVLVLSTASSSVSLAQEANPITAYAQLNKEIDSIPDKCLADLACIFVFHRGRLCA